MGNANAQEMKRPALSMDDPVEWLTEQCGGLHGIAALDLRTSCTLTVQFGTPADRVQFARIIARAVSVRLGKIAAPSYE